MKLEMMLLSCQENTCAMLWVDVPIYQQTIRQRDSMAVIVLGEERVEGCVVSSRKKIIFFVCKYQKCFICKC